jgi:hypothetical protein
MAMSIDFFGRAMALGHRIRLTAGRKAWLIVGLMLLTVIQIVPVQICQAESAPVSVNLAGWGWCLAYRPIGNVAANLTGSMTPRGDAPEISDVYLTGTLLFNLSDRTDSFALELRGTKVRSLFFLKQVSGGDTPLIAEFEGTWLSDNGTNYIACEGRLAITAPNHVAKPYVFVLRTTGTDVPSREQGNFVANVEFIIQKTTYAFDVIADRLADTGSQIKELLGDVLTQTAVLAREVRKLGTPYFT